MICVLASITIKPGFKEEFLQIFKDNIPAVLAETGCIEYTPMIDIPSGFDIQEMDENTITIVEKWDSLDALNAHLAAPHMRAYKEKTKAMLERLSLKILQNA